MLVRLLGSLLLLLSTCSIARQEIIREVSSDSTRDQLVSIATLQHEGKLPQAEAAALVLLEKARGENHQADIAAAFHQLGHISSLQNRYDLAERAFNSALEIYTREEMLPQIAVLLADLGENYRYQAKYADALDYLYRSQSIYQSLGDRSGVAEQHLKIGVVLKSLGQFEPALESLQLALGTLRSENALASVSESLTHIGDIYADMEQYGDAEAYLKDALAISEQLEQSQRIAKGHSNLGELYLNMQRYEDARTHLNRAIELFESLGAPRDHDWALSTLGEVELALGNSGEGLHHLNDALLRATQNGFEQLATHIRLALARAFLKLNDLDIALIHANNGLKEAEKRDELKTQVELLDVKVSLYTAIGDYEKAFDSLSRKNRLETMMIDRNSAMTMAQIQSELEVERQAQSIELLRKNKAIELARAEQKNLRTTLFLGSLVAFLLLIFLLWSRFSQRQLTITLKREVRSRTKELEQKNNQLEEAYRTLEQVSLRDPLTGLYNRHYLETQLPGEIQRCQHAYANNIESQPSNSDLLCFLLDIDYFKQINDEYGHLAGDRFLIQFTRVIHEVFRQTDLLIRWGGEEFLVICRHANRQDMAGLAERFRVAVRQQQFDLGEGQHVQATCSIGFCSLPLDTSRPYEYDWQRTFAMMDYCLYAAKLSGRDSWVGILEATESAEVKQAPSPLEKKFGLTDTQLATSLNNVASIVWPDE